MKTWLFFLSAAVAVAAESVPGWSLEASAQARLGFDSNPIAADGTAAQVLGRESVMITSVGANLAGAWSPARPDAFAGRWSYNAERQDFAGRAAEDFTLHRFAAAGQLAAAGWKIFGEGSSVWIDGNRDTLVSVAAANANATALWRERRAQWQHRGKLQAQREAGPWLARLAGSWLAYDYRTRVVAGRAAFADRSDLLGGFDAGWKQSSRSLWFGGLRVGDQRQDQIGLPNCQFDYSSRYARVVAGWEGRLGAATTANFAAGPDFRHFDGGVDPRIFAQRDHTSLWFEGGFNSKLSSALALSGKTTRWVWLSSTGKSAYRDFAAEVALGWTVAPAWTVRATAKAHQCSYFPVVRNDWESLAGTGVTWKRGARLQFAADVLWHRGWNAFGDIPERAFARVVSTLGVSLRY